MASRQTFLLDTSALNRADTSSVSRRLAPLNEQLALASCQIVALEALYSARNLHVFERLTRTLAALIDEPITPATLARARFVQHELARIGHHRLPIADLIIAAAAESGGHTVLHYDKDFERIAAVTGQPHEWVVPRGSL